MKNYYTIFLTILSLAALAGCSKSHKHPHSNSIGSDDIPVSSCANCKLKPFYVDGNWIEKRG